MSNGVTPDMLDPATPKEVKITAEAPEPFTDPTVGVPLDPVDPKLATPPHRLVTIGDSLTHGFQSGAVYNTDLSWPAIVAYELGWYDQFRRPVYGGPGGLPINLELLVRDLEHRFGSKFDVWETPFVLFEGRQFMDRVEDYWERGPGASFPKVNGINHNLGIYGWDLRDTLVRTWASSQAQLATPKDDLLKQVTENNGQRAAMYVLPSEPEARRTLTALGAAAELGNEGPRAQPGIETLVVMLGANNALSTVTGLKVKWSGPGYDQLGTKEQYTVFTPSHFKAELDLVAAEVRKIKARHVIWATVPHVTIAPIARGLGPKMRPGSRYYPFYTRPWIDERRFDAHRDPNITHAQARAVDSAIDMYNQSIVDMVAAARKEAKPLRWYVLDMAGLLDGLAARRYQEDPLARPPWWTPYELPAALRGLSPVPDSRFLLGGPAGRTAGGLFSLDGVHPTTVAYGVLAQEVINIMQGAGVKFLTPTGTERTGPVHVDFDRLVQRDTLVKSPPRWVTQGLSVLGWADQALDAVKLALPF
jgi:hypothetical protein